MPFGGEESHARCVGTGLWQLEATRRAEEFVGDLGQDPRPVPGPRVAALGAAVFEVAQHPQCPGHHIVTAASGQVRDETDATGIVLELGVVKASSRHALSRRLSKTPHQCAGDDTGPVTQTLHHRKNPLPELAWGTREPTVCARVWSGTCPPRRGRKQRCRRAHRSACRGHAATGRPATTPPRRAKKTLPCGLPRKARRLAPGPRLYLPRLGGGRRRSRRSRRRRTPPPGPPGRRC